MSSDNVDSEFNEKISKRLKQIRTNKKLSLEDVVKKMENPVSRQALYKYESNQARIKTSIFLDLCNALDVEPADVFSDANDDSINNTQPQNELLFSKNKNILTESDWGIINAIIEQRKKEIDKELDGE